MKNISNLKKNTFRLSHYSAMAVCLIAMETADGQIVYQDIDDITIEPIDTFDIDLDMNGTLDFEFRAGTGNSGTQTFGSIFGVVTSASIGNPSNQIAGYVGDFYDYASALNAGVTVNAANNWLSYPSYSNSAVIVSFFNSSVYGEFAGAGDKYLALKFKIGSELHYGWMRIEATADPVVITIKDYAYNSTANAEIITGDTTTTTGVNSVSGNDNISAYSFGKTIYIANSNNSELITAVNIINLSGAIVYSDALNKNNAIIDLNEFANGIYTVQIFTGKEVVSKELLIAD